MGVAARAAVTQVAAKAVVARVAARVAVVRATERWAVREVLRVAAVAVVARAEWEAARLVAARAAEHTHSCPLTPSAGLHIGCKRRRTWREAARRRTVTTGKQCSVGGTIHQ
jgi:hypothetical protein